MQVENRWQKDQGSPTAHGGFQGQGRGGGRGAKICLVHIICYNCREPGHFTHDYQNPTHPSCQYCRQFDHVIEYFPILIANMKENKNQQSTQNIQMMRSKLCEDDLVSTQSREVVQPLVKTRLKENNQNQSHCSKKSMRRILGMIYINKKRHLWRQERIL